MQNHLVKTPITQIRNILEDVVVQLSALSQRIFRSKAKKQQGSLRIAINKGTPQYYHITTKGDTNGKYIPKSDSKLISSLAQKEYLEKCNRIIERQQKALARFLKDFHPEDIIAVHTNLTEAKRRFVTPLLLTDEEFAAQWQAKPYSGKFFAKDTPEHFTNSGLRVRSKSEVIIAECLARHNIPFRYEAPLELIIGDTSSITAETPTNNIRRRTLNQDADLMQSKAVTFYPDFTCLNKRTRQEFIWEHFGMMDNPNYARNAIEKQRSYAAAGYIPGINFIATTETTDLPLNIPYVEQMTKSLLM
ncbi:hypothetical protein SAMN05720766_104200 [Fibrobacter sp. UWH9]|uniref:hypothetical protein n=1 Tax=unclassified Fibrobacter TaxID=2634177 RepID=UPI000911B8DE|nr:MULTISPECIES: hypothetical protein [unclassified Fibrobacter]SHG82754.1 hypothetical protein SAMN05720766_104200 [Fibrobacter sp. UWH9]SHK80224.1 hypothetical protein SAMN05720764_10480 [Fibrobacter sp. UWH5]